MIKCKCSLFVLVGNHHCIVFLSLPVMDGSLTATLTGSAASSGDSLPVFSHFVSQKKHFIMCYCVYGAI